MQFIVLGLILHEFIEFMIHGIFACDVGLDCLYLLEYLLLVLPVVVVEVVVVGPDVGLQDIEHAISHVLALARLHRLVDQVGQLLNLLDWVIAGVHLNCDVTVMGFDGCLEVDLVLCISVSIINIMEGQRGDGGYLIVSLWVIILVVHEKQ